MDAYVNRLGKLASSCEFGTLTDELIRDRLVIGVRDKDLKGRLLGQKGLSLQKAMELSKSNEVTKQQLKSLESEEKKSSVEEVHEVQSKGRPRHKKSKKLFTQNQKKKTRDSKDEPGRTPPKGKCKYCGNQMHRKRQDCPAYGQVCLKCNKSSHFASVCNAKRSDLVNVVFDEDDSESDLSVDSWF